MAGDKKIFLVQPLNTGKCHPGKNISRYDIIQHRQTTTDRHFFLCLSENWLGYGMEINRQIDFG